MKDEIERGDILVTSEAPFGQIFLWDSDEKIILSQRLFAIRPRKTVCDSHYLFYWMCSHHFQSEMQSRATGTTVIGLRQPELLKCTVELPDMCTQLKISQVLKDIDSQICNLRQTNDYLAAIGQELFERYLGLSDLRRGSVGVLGDIAEGNPKRVLRKGAEAKCVDMSRLSSSSPFPNGWIEKEYNGGMRFTNGDTLIARITPCLENGKTAFVNFLDAGEVAFGSTEYIVLASKSSVPNEALYFLARNADFIGYMVGHMNGSSGRQRVSVADALSYPIHIPDSTDIETVGGTLISIMNAILANSQQAMKLSKFRDTLLPKLMSGELDISKVDVTLQN